MVKETTSYALTPTGPIDCACLIHGDVYSWNYVDRLYNMLSRNITPGIRLHVYTEHNRAVPTPYIKHSLIDWNITGPKKSWWYKMQLFDPTHHSGSLLYFDLDTVIVNNIDWIWQLPLRYFWAVKDFKYLWRTSHSGINSSVMWWDTKSYAYVWNDFKQKKLQDIMRRCHGDQDYLNTAIPEIYRRFLNEQQIRSWRWQALDGGYDFKIKAYKQPGIGTQINKTDSVLVFHGHPKPDEIHDSVVERYWK